MDFLPSDLASFVWGFVLAAIGIFSTKVVQKAADDFYSWSKNKIFPKPPEPIEVEQTFVPTRFDPSQCAWANELRLHDYEAKGYRYYPHPKTGGRCFRRPDATNQVREFLMVGSNAKEIASA